MKTIKSVAEEKADCIAAWEANTDAIAAFFCHHKVPLEPLVEPFMNRINYIETDKPLEEQAARYRNFRPFVGILPACLQQALTNFQKAWADRLEANEAYRNDGAASWKTYSAWQKADAARWKAGAAWQKAWAYWPDAVKVHNQQWPDNTWDGESIFTKDKV